VVSLIVLLAAAELFNGGGISIASLGVEVVLADSSVVPVAFDC